MAEQKMEFKQYKRKGLSEMIPLKEFVGQDMSTVSVSEQDKLLSKEEFEQGYIARNPKNHADMWYVAKKYFDDNLEEAFTRSNNMTFGEATEAMKKGLRCARVGWNGSGMFAIYSPGSSSPLKNEDWFSPAMREYTKDGKELNVRPSFLLKTAQEDVAYWAPSGSDALAEDWMIV